MPAHIIYRKSKTAPIPTVDVEKNEPLESIEIDGNFRGLKLMVNDLELKTINLKSEIDNIVVNSTASSTGNGTVPSAVSTNLSSLVTHTSVTIVSDTGTDAVIPLATQSTSGVMSPTDKSKLDSLASGSGTGTTGGQVVTSTKIKIAVIGDSLTAQADALHEPWPILLERSLNAGGLECEVYNLAIGGHTFSLAMTDKVFGGKSQVDRAIDIGADVVIVALGANDIITAGAPKSNSAIQTDASNLFSSLRSGLPSAKIIYGREIGWDITHKPTGTSLLNRHVAPFFMALPSSGYLTNCYSSRILDNPLTTYATRFANWIVVDTFIRGLTSINGSFDLDHYKCARLGLIGEDTIHLTAEGAKMFCGWTRKAFNNITALSSIAPSLRIQTKVAGTNTAVNDDPDEVFKLFCTSDGTKWIDNTPSPTSGHISTNSGMIRGIRPHSWFMPSKGALSTGLNTIYENGIATWSIENAKPNSSVYISGNGGAWNDSSFKTSPKGNLTIAQPYEEIADGVTDFYAKVGNEIFGPYSITKATPTGGSSASSDYVIYTSTSQQKISVAISDTKIGSWTRDSSSNTVTYSSSNFTVPAGTWVVTLSLGLRLTAGTSAYAIFKPSSSTETALTAVTCSSAHNPLSAVNYGVTAGSSIIQLTSATDFSCFVIADATTVELNSDRYAHKLTFQKIA